MVGSASLTIWTTQLSTLESRAAEHDRFSSELISQLADPLKNLAARYEEIRKSHAEYAAKLEKERDASYGNLKKTKSRYDGACQEVENKRRKIDSSFDRSKQKAQNAYQQQVMDMHNVKVWPVQGLNLRCSAAYREQNTYLIDINITNKQKEQYYHEYVPDLLDVRSPIQLYPTFAYVIKTEPARPIRESLPPSEFNMVTRRTT